jgi:nucleotide-binding universal stress UspA family protein
MLPRSSSCSTNRPRPTSRSRARAGWVPGRSGFKVGIDAGHQPAGLRALRAAVEQARILHRELLAVRAFAAPMERGIAVAACEKEASGVIELAFEHVMGGVPDDDPAVYPTVRLGRPGPVLVEAAHLEADLLVIGATTPQWRRQLGRSTARYCTFYAACPVLLIPPNDIHAVLSADRFGRRRVCETRRLP